MQGERESVLAAFIRVNETVDVCKVVFAHINTFKTCVVLHCTEPKCGEKGSLCWLQY
jgi:hypothetical protein